MKLEYIGHDNFTITFICRDKHIKEMDALTKYLVDGSQEDFKKGISEGETIRFLQSGISNVPPQAWKILMMNERLLRKRYG